MKQGNSECDNAREGSLRQTVVAFYYNKKRYFVMCRRFRVARRSVTDKFLDIFKITRMNLPTN